MFDKFLESCLVPLLLLAGVVLYFWVRYEWQTMRKHNEATRFANTPEPVTRGPQVAAREPANGAPAKTCPFLGMQGAPDIQCSYPSRGHRCHSESGDPSYPRRAYQGEWCMTAKHAQCPDYRLATGGRHSQNKVGDDV